jgi:predicted dehydrogenase
MAQALALQNGQLGTIRGGNIYWCGGWGSVRPRKPGASNAQYMCNNWMNWAQMSGDHIVEQHVHNIDIANWFLGRLPKTALGFGGRARRVSGNQYDFFSIDFDYGDGVHIHSMCRQISGTSGGGVSAHFRTPEYEISGGGKVQKVGEKEALKLEGDFRDGNPYEIEHIHLLEGILSGKVVNEGENVAMSTACAIAGRMSAYTGQIIRLNELFDEKFKDSQFYSFACKPSWADFEGAGDVAMPELGDEKWPLPGKPWGQK